MRIALKIYNIFFWNSSLKEKSGGTKLCCSTIARTAKTCDAKSYRQTIISNFKIKKMKTTKMSVAKIEGKLSRVEMKNIMAGGGSTGCYKCCRDSNGLCSDCAYSYSSAPCESGCSLKSCSGC